MNSKHLSDLISQVEAPIRGKESFLTTDLFLFILPLIIGIVVAVINSSKIADFTDRFKNWLTDRKKRLDTRRGIIPRFIFKPLIFILLKVAEWTAEIKHDGIKAGTRIAAYIYIIEIFIFILVVLGYILLVFLFIIIGLWIFLWILGRILGGPKEEVRENIYVESVRKEPSFYESVFFFLTTEKEKLKNLFKVKHIDVDKEGGIFSDDYSNILSKGKIGFVDEEGHIFDTRETLRKKIGYIDSEGHVKEFW